MDFLTRIAALPLWVSVPLFWFGGSIVVAVVLTWFCRLAADRKALEAKLHLHDRAVQAWRSEPTALSRLEIARWRAEAPYVRLALRLVREME